MSTTNVRYIPISKCPKCPYYGHKGAFGAVSNVPVCGYAKRTLPYTVHEKKIGVSIHVFASVTEDIPAWCHLAKLQNPQESNYET